MMPWEYVVTSDRATGKQLGVLGDTFAVFYDVTVEQVAETSRMSDGAPLTGFTTRTGETAALRWYAPNHWTVEVTS